MKRMFFKSVIAIGVALLMTVSSFAQVFADVSQEHFAYEKINDFYEKGIVVGDGDGNFRPDDLITREEFCKILIKSFGYIANNDVKSSFADVEDGRWSKAYIEACQDFLPGKVAENGEKKFAPDIAVFKEDLVAATVMMMGYPTVLAEGIESAKEVFSDGETISDALSEQISIAVKMGVVDAESDVFDAKNGITRADAVEFVDNALNIYEDSVLDWDDVFVQLDAAVPGGVYDTTVIMTVGEYEVTLAEYRYYYMSYFNQFTSTFGPEWIKYDEYLNVFENYLLESIKMGGTVAKIASEYGIGYSQKLLQEMIVKSYIYFIGTFGEECEEYLFDNYFATLNFAIKNDLLIDCYNRLLDSVYVKGTEKGEELKETVLETYKENSYVRAKHILISTEAREKSEAGEFAQNILSKIKAGEDFDKLMMEYNEDPGVEQFPNGYYFKKGEMVEPFENAVYSLEVGEVSLVETDFGYHIVKKLPIDDEDIYTSPLYMTISYNEFDAYIKEQLSVIEVKKYDDFVSLISPVLEEAAQMLEENK